MGSRDRAPGQGRQSPHEAESFEAFVCLKEGQKPIAKMPALST